jgi:peroxiredoxin Q/BCP
MRSNWSMLSGSIFRMSFLAVAVLIGCGTRSFAVPPADFTVESPAQGVKFQLSKAKGKVVALHFLLKTECPICLRHTHAYARLAEQQPDVVHVFLKPDSAEEIKAWTSHLSQDELKELPVIYRDPDAALAKAYRIPDGYRFHGEVVHFPALVVLDATGAELFRYVGKNNGDRLSPADFEARLAKAGSTGKK